MTSARDTSPGEAPPARRRHPLAVLGLVLSLLLVVGIVVANAVTAPYVVFTPGGAYDVLAEDGPGDGPMLRVDGHETFPTDGALRMTTVAMYGGPGHELSWWEVGTSWLGGQDEILPRSRVFPEDVTADQVQKVSTAQMTGSQSSAETVALRAAGVPVTEKVVVAQAVPGAPAEGRLEAEDTIVSVDGAKATSVQVVQQAVQRAGAGSTVRVVVQRKGTQRTVTVPTRQMEGRTVVGVQLATLAESPVDVHVDAGSVGGPSAGMMLALGIYDKLTEGPLTGGQDVAGTGTIDSDGTVGPIDGIAQKMHGAREAGATWFLAPDDNCEQVVGHVPEGMHDVAVTDFAEARRAVEAIAAGSTDALPTCEEHLAGR